MATDTLRRHSLTSDRGGAALVGTLLAVALAVPVLNLGFGEASPLHLSTYALTLVGKYLCYAMLALAVDLIWGYCGILSLGHAAECQPHKGRLSESVPLDQEVNDLAGRGIDRNHNARLYWWHALTSEMIIARC